MLIDFNEEGRVLWYNTHISREMAEACLSPHTVWLEGELPPTPEPQEGMTAYLVYENGALAYAFEPAPTPVYTETQVIMQALADLELLLLEGGIIHV